VPEPEPEPQSQPGTFFISSLRFLDMVARSCYARGYIKLQLKVNIIEFYVVIAIVLV